MEDSFGHVKILNNMADKMEIFKIQMPLSSNDTNPPALIYNEDRSIQGHIEITPELKEAMDSRPKAFFYGERFTNDNGELAMGWRQEAPWQEW